MAPARCAGRVAEHAEVEVLCLAQGVGGLGGAGPDHRPRPRPSTTATVTISRRGERHPAAAQHLQRAGPGWCFGGHSSSALPRLASAMPSSAVSMPSPGAARSAGPAWREEGQDQLELAALARRAAHPHLAAVRVGHGAHQGQAQAGALGPVPPPLRRAGEPVRNRSKMRVKLGGQDPLAACPRRSYAPAARAARQHGQLDHVAVGGMPDGVLQQRVHREAEPLPVRADRDRVQPAELPAPLRGRPPLAG